MERLRTIRESINEAMDPNYKKWRKANVTYRGTREDNPWPLDGINEYEGKFGVGLYTTPLSNKAMTKEYGKTWLIVGAIPQKPLKFKSINEAEIWLQGYAIKNGKGKDDIEKLRGFWKKTTIEKEMMKAGYDGIEVVGREMVLFNPDKNKLRAFETERQLEMWYDDFFSPSTDRIEWDESGSVAVPKKPAMAAKEAATAKPNPALKKFEDWLKKEWLAMEKMKGKAKEAKQTELEEIMLDLVADKQSDYVDSVLNDGGEMNPKLFWEVCDEKRVKEYAKSIKESKNIVKTKGGQEIDLDEYEAKQTILGTIYIHKDRLKPSVFGDLE